MSPFKGIKSQQREQRKGSAIKVGIKKRKSYKCIMPPFMQTWSCAKLLFKQQIFSHCIIKVSISQNKMYISLMERGFKRKFFCGQISPKTFISAVDLSRETFAIEIIRRRKKKK
jgi:hypothetical protein